MPVPIGVYDGSLGRFNLRLEVGGLLREGPSCSSPGLFQAVIAASALRCRSYFRLGFSWDA